ncbi:MAG: 23S rRNA (adenine(2503)-C(2))-methyltransferase RlmN [Acidobacteria bacterium]|nr:MAG: 23S rRNA (adenine(2503)-C(2))-methyltransferase RlmN [Acidobacteriota bacterium]
MASVPDISAARNLYGSALAELGALVASLGEPPYRARQIFRAMYRRDALVPAGWSDLPAGLRRRLSERHVVRRPWVAGRRDAADGTRKYLLDLPAGGQVEAVAIPARERWTFCISSQIGCAFGCRFCMTARLGFTRHLTPGEIVGQVAALRADTGAPHGAYNIVFMGMGEPLHNLRGVMGALEILLHPLGFALRPRRITVSTVGLPDRIARLASLPEPPRLAVSLVTADPALRRELMPAARAVRLEDLAAAIRAYGAGRRDRPTLEVVMLAGVNDGPSHAAALARFARAARAKVNLIEFNPTPELPFRPSPEARVHGFLRSLSRAGVVGTVRRSRGRDIDAACGQLAFTGAAAERPAR